MTDEQIKRQKADLLLEFQETQQKLESLRLRATHLGETLETFAKWIKLSPETRIFDASQAHHGFNAEITPQKYIDALEVRQHFALAEEIRETSEKLRQMEAQKQRLGLK
jgi:hypothetical protein